MKRKIVMAITIASVLLISTKVFAQTKIGTLDEVPMWSVPDAPKIEATAHKADSTMKELQKKAAASRVVVGTYYSATDDGSRYRSASCEITCSNGDGCRIYLYDEQVMCTLNFSGAGKSYTSIMVKVSSTSQAVEYHGGGNTRPFFLADKTPDMLFFSNGLASLQKVLETERKKYN